MDCIKLKIKTDDAIYRKMMNMIAAGSAKSLSKFYAAGAGGALGVAAATGVPALDEVAAVAAVLPLVLAVSGAEAAASGCAGFHGTS